MGKVKEKDLKQKLEDDMWKIAKKYGQNGDTYHWTLTITDEDDNEVEFEGGCNY